MSADDEPTGLTASFKTHAGFDSPLLVIRGKDAADLADRIRAAQASGLFAIIAEADKELHAVRNVAGEFQVEPAAHPSTGGQGGGYQGGGNGGQQRQGGGNFRGRPAPPAGVEVPSCPHGTKVYREGTNARGPWKGWYCPAPQTDPTRCKAQFF